MNQISHHYGRGRFITACARLGMAESSLPEKAVFGTGNNHNSKRTRVRKYVVGCHVTVEIC